MIPFKPLAPGATLGVFTPSSPAYTSNPGLFENGVRNLEKLGFQIKLGALNCARTKRTSPSSSFEA